MRLLFLLLLSPAVFAQRHRINDPNDEPFLPIYPVYPYNPKLIKRATDRELIPQLPPELYAPKVDAKDSYTATYSNNYQRDSYYPNYESYPKSTSPSSSYPSYYNGDTYTYANVPYTMYNSYPAPYTINPTGYQTPPYPNYYYQPPYYYPHYLNPALFPPPPPPPPPPSNVNYHDSSQESETEDIKQVENKKNKKSQEDETNQDSSTFVDGGNYISGSSRDLDGQSTTYKIGNRYNQLDQDVELRNLPIPLPKTTYRVISVAGQPVGPNYPLPSAYVKAQQMEQLVTQTLSKLLAQKQVDHSYENEKYTLNSANNEPYANQNTYNPNISSYVTLPGVRTKSGTTYVINSDNIPRINQENIQKPKSQAIPNHSQEIYISPDNRNKHPDRVTDNQSTVQMDEYDSYDASQNYGSALNHSENKQEQKYENYQSQSDAYQNKDFNTASQTPRSYTFQYSAYEADQSTAQQSDKTKSDNGNFGVKHNKG